MHIIKCRNLGDWLLASGPKKRRKTSKIDANMPKLAQNQRINDAKHCSEILVSGVLDFSRYDTDIQKHKWRYINVYISTLLQATDRTVRQTTTPPTSSRTNSVRSTTTVTITCSTRNRPTAPATRLSTTRLTRQTTTTIRVGDFNDSSHYLILSIL